MSGDEFVLFEVVEMIDPEEYIYKINKLIDFIESNPISLPVIKDVINLSVTIGMTFESENSYGKADMAVQEARRHGRAFLAFSAQADKRKNMQQNIYWKDAINKALKENRVHAFYQPIVDKEQKVIKYEALMRIKEYDANGAVNLIEPHLFLDHSKVSRQYISLTKVMIHKAFELMIEKNLHISINLTFFDIENKEINHILQENIHKHQLASQTNFDISSQVIFELLEHPKKIMIYLLRLLKDTRNKG